MGNERYLVDMVHYTMMVFAPVVGFSFMFNVLDHVLVALVMVHKHPLLVLDLVLFLVKIVLFLLDLIKLRLHPVHALLFISFVVGNMRHSRINPMHLRLHFLHLVLQGPELAEEHHDDADQYDNNKGSGLLQLFNNGLIVILSPPLFFFVVESVPSLVAHKFGVK
jgi:hypothetical protein